MPHTTSSSEEWFDELATQAEDQEFSKIQQNIWKEGYKEGISDSKDVGLQKGFETGFAECANICSALGELKGNLRAVQQFASTKAPEDLIALENLMKEIDDFTNNAGKINLQTEAKSLSDFSCQTDLQQLQLTSTVADFLSRGSLLIQDNPS